MINQEILQNLINKAWRQFKIKITVLTGRQYDILRSSNKKSAETQLKKIRKKLYDL